MKYPLQQIREKEARNVCHTYKCLLKKKNENNNQWKKDEHEKYFNDLPFSVPNAAKKLCRSSLRYKGKLDMIFFCIVYIINIKQNNNHASYVYAKYNISLV